MTEGEIIRKGNGIMCPNCNGINDKENDRSCWNCGAEVPN